MEKKKVYVASNVLGLFAFDDEGRLVGYVTYPRDPRAVAERMKKGISAVPETTLLSGQLADYECIFDEEGQKSGMMYLKRQMDEVLGAAKVGRGEYDSLVRKVSLLLAKGDLKLAMGREDLLLMQAIESIDDLDEALNILAERLREWYSLHFPELSREVNEHEKFASLIEAHGSRRGFEGGEYGEIARASSGVELKNADAAILKDFAIQVKDIYALRASHENYLTEKMQALAPNVADLAGPLVGAKLISLAGGIMELAKMPGSRIQVLGAEKAMFRHIKERGLPPKHGAIFQHPLLKMAPWWQRGRIARSFAAKIAIAARADAFSKGYIAGDLKAALEARVESVRKTAKPKKMRIIRAPRTDERRFKGKNKRRGRWK